MSYNPKGDATQYLVKRARYEREFDRLTEENREAHAAVERTVLALEHLKAPTWSEEMVEPIARILAERNPGHNFKVLGPFGIAARVSIHAYEGKDVAGCIGGIAFEFDHKANELQLVDYSKKVREYPPNSLGALNGLHWGTVPMPATIEEIEAIVFGGEA